MTRWSRSKSPLRISLRMSSSSSDLATDSFFLSVEAFLHVDASSSSADVGRVEFLLDARIRVTDCIFDSFRRWCSRRFVICCWWCEIWSWMEIKVSSVREQFLERSKFSEEKKIHINRIINASINKPTKSIKLSINQLQIQRHNKVPNQAIHQNNCYEIEDTTQVEIGKFTDSLPIAFSLHCAAFSNSWRLA